MPSPASIPRASRWGATALWPDRRERLRILRMWRRQQRRPNALSALPASWRQQRRLVFWWSMARFAQDKPVLMLAAMLGWPLWVAFRCWSLWFS